MESNLESRIIAECISGNWTNFQQVYDVYLPKIYQYLYYRTRHKQTAQDLTSTVFMKAVSRIGTFRIGESAFLSWLYGISRNTLIDHFRAQKPTLDIEQAYGLASPDDVAKQADQAMKLDSVKGMLSQLSETQREVLTMRVWDQLTHREISEILGISEANSKVTYSRAVETLKKIIPDNTYA